MSGFLSKFVGKYNSRLDNTMKSVNFLAVDLGATSGRTILGTLEDGRLQQRELTRFPNHIIQVGGHWHWDLLALYREVLEALKLVASEGVELQSIGIDTWGCDFAMFGHDGGLLRQPYCYRDPQTEGAMEHFFERMAKEKVYERTGIQFMPFNSLFQLDTLRRNEDSALRVADKILFIPDALTYLLTGEQVCEYTVLSTSQLLNPRTRELDLALLTELELKKRNFGRMVEPGEQVGVLTEEVQRLTGLGPVPVVAVAGHDTASAVAAVPAEDERFAYLSCGTWSLLGIESPTPIISEKSLEYNFTNEGGVEGTTRVLKNICGMWLLEQCRKESPSWPSDINEINRGAMEAMPGQSIINPDDPRFANPVSMVDAIRGYCSETDQHVPQDYREMARCIFESLARRYRQVLDWLRDLAPMPIERLHVIGGGSRNEQLMQMTADAIGMPVIAGPAEGTALGNMLLQAKAAGIVKDLQEMRQVVRRSIETRTYQPASSPERE